MGPQPLCRRTTLPGPPLRCRGAGSLREEVFPARRSDAGLAGQRRPGRCSPKRAPTTTRSDAGRAVSTATSVLPIRSARLKVNPSESKRILGGGYEHGTVFEDGRLSWRAAVGRDRFVGKGSSSSQDAATSGSETRATRTSAAPPWAGSLREEVLRGAAGATPEPPLARHFAARSARKVFPARRRKLRPGRACSPFTARGSRGIQVNPTGKDI